MFFFGDDGNKINLLTCMFETNTLRSFVNIVKSLKYKKLHMRMQIQATQIQAKISNKKISGTFFFIVILF
jgi:hypothetical protein